MRFALLEMKVAAFALLQRFNFLPTNVSQEPLVLDSSCTFGWIRGGLRVRVEERKNVLNS